jgi:uncharacterized protein YcnI
MTVRSLTLTAAILLTSAATVLAHAVVFPAEAPPGAYQKYVLRVPNERAFPTTRVHLTFPPGVRVISFDEVPGWALDAVSADGGATFTEAMWTGTLPVGRFVEFGFIGVNPGEPTTLKWDAVQEYGDGTIVEWTGPVDSPTPASLTRVVAPGEPAPASGSGSAGVLLGGGALALALLSLGLALRPGRDA